MTANDSTIRVVSSNAAAQSADGPPRQRRRTALDQVFDEVAWIGDTAQNAINRPQQRAGRVYQDGYRGVSDDSLIQERYYAASQDTAAWERLTDVHERYADLGSRISGGMPVRGWLPVEYEDALRETSLHASEARKDAKAVTKAHKELSEKVAELERALDQKDVVIEALEAAVQEQGQLLNKLVRLLSKMKGESYVAGN